MKNKWFIPVIILAVLFIIGDASMVVTYPNDLR